MEIKIKEKKIEIQNLLKQEKNERASTNITSYLEVCRNIV